MFVIFNVFIKFSNVRILFYLIKVMDICRICLSNDVNKDICQLQISKKDNSNYINILLFCLDIQITEDSTVGRKLCLKCYKKVISFHKFKTLALKNDAYLKSLGPDIKHEVYMTDDEYPEVSLNPEESLKPEKSSNNNDCLSAKVKAEVVVKIEDDEEYNESDNELVSVLKKIKYEYVMEETKENAPVRKRGRPKLPKSNEKKLEVCEECGKAVRDLNQHLKRHQPLEDRLRFKCKVCEKVFSSYGARYKHNKIKHLGIKKRCEICSKEVVDLRHHRLIMHNVEGLKFACPSCGRRFVTQSALDAHSTTHTKDKPFHCDICDKQFRLKVVMMHHIRQVHEKEKSHLCQFCSKSFFKKYHLHLHLRSHTKEKPHPCPECGKAFSSTTILKNHRLTHSTVKPFQCNFCDSRFVRSEYLRTHMICHTKEKRHPCKYCGVRFGRSDHRKRHEFTAHEKHLLTPA